MWGALRSWLIWFHTPSRRFLLLRPLVVSWKAATVQVQVLAGRKGAHTPLKYQGSLFGWVMASRVVTGRVAASCESQAKLRLQQGQRTLREDATGNRFREPTQPLP